MKYAVSESRSAGGARTVHFIFSERETTILLEIVGDLKPDQVFEALEVGDVTKEDVAKFLHSLFQALNECL